MTCINRRLARRRQAGSSGALHSRDCRLTSPAVAHFSQKIHLLTSVLQLPSSPSCHQLKKQLRPKLYSVKFCNALMPPRRPAASFLSAMSGWTYSIVCQFYKWFPTRLLAAPFQTEDDDKKMWHSHIPPVVFDFCFPSLAFLKWKDLSRKNM